MTEEGQDPNQLKTGKRNPAKLVRRKRNQFKANMDTGVLYLMITSNGEIIQTAIDMRLKQAIDLITWSVVRAENGFYFSGLLPNAAQEKSKPVSLHEFVYIMSNDLGIVTTFIPDHIESDIDRRNDGKSLYMKIEPIFRDTGLVVDHKDRDTLNNRATNLRLLPQQLNSMNSDRVLKGSSMYPGVSLDKDYRKFRAITTVNGEQKTLGYSDRPEEAAALVLAKLIEIYPRLDWDSLAVEFFPEIQIPCK